MTGRRRRPGIATSVAVLGMALVATCTRWVPPQPPVVVAIPVYNPPDTATARNPRQPPRSQPRTTPLPTGVRDVGDTTIRVLLTTAAARFQLSAPAIVSFSDRSGAFVARGTTGGAWNVERQGRRLRATRADGVASRWTDGALYAQSGDAGLLSLAGKPYRGDIMFVASDSGINAINVLRIDDYLRGVVPLEIGTRSAADSAAVQAQAITARSYAYIHLTSGSRAWDVTSGTQDQVYGGVIAETEVASQAVESTRTLVLKYGGRIVNAPYSSTCGGSTAAASEIWRSSDEPYLQRVSDEIPGTGRYYCDIAPRFRWTRSLEREQINTALARYLANYVSNGKNPGTALSVGVASRTPSGRVGNLLVRTDRGAYTLRGNDIRYVLRVAGGEILNSTYFSVQETPGADGSLARLTITGTGYGHGVGMCQWGAIGRARAGQDFRTILRTYYPGTTVGPPE